MTGRRSQIHPHPWVSGALVSYCNLEFVSVWRFISPVCFTWDVYHILVALCRYGRDKPMPANIHLLLMQICYIAPPGSFLLFVLSGICSSWYLNLGRILGSISLVLFVFLWILFIILPFLPARCLTPGCKGRMHRTSNRISLHKEKLQYKCPLCNNTLQGIIFSQEATSPFDWRWDSICFGWFLLTRLWALQVFRLWPLFLPTACSADS